MGKKRECMFAGTGGVCSGPVTYGPDPFNADIDNDFTKVWECEGHRETRSDDV